MSLAFLGLRRSLTLPLSRPSPSDLYDTKLLLSLLVALLGSASWHKSVHADPPRILMVGNSFTASTVGDLRGFLTADIGPVSLDTVTLGGRTLFGHYTSRRPNPKLTVTDWDVVILQDAGATPAFANVLPDPPLDITKAGIDVSQSREAAYHSFWIGGRGLSDALTTANPDVNLVYFSSWPAHEDLFVSPTRILDSPAVMQEHTNASYAALSSEYSGSRVAPVGDAWLESFNQRPELRLHAFDNVHANELGSYLAGAVLYEIVTGRSSVNSGYTGGLSAVDARYLQGIATATTQVPEPSSLFLAGFGVVGLLSYFG